MYFKKYLEKYKNKEIKLFVDMDGVIADYIFGSAKDYDKKRPLIDSIEKLKEISIMNNIELFIFSATRMTEGIEQKNIWLDKYAPFFKKENRIIISREKNNMEDSAILKAKYLKDFKRDGSIIIVIDDDPKNLREIHKLNEDVILLKDTVLVDDIKNTEKYYFIALCNAYKNISWKSRNTSNNDIENLKDYFIVGINTPSGSIVKRLEMEFWDELEIFELDKVPQYNNCNEEDIKICIKSLH